MKTGMSKAVQTSILRRAGAALGVIAIMGTSASGSWAAECETTAVAAATPVKAVAPAQSAKDIRRLQSELMVSALACGHRSQYNAFARSYRAELKRNGKFLKSHFRAEHGAAGERALNRYVTALANEASMRLASNADYCAQTETAFEFLLTGLGDNMGLERIAYHYAETDQDLNRLAADNSCDDSAQISTRTD